MNPQQFKGTGVALVTPFVDGQIDFSSLEKIINHVILGGVDYIVALGTTGEAITLSTVECKAVLDFTIKIVAGRKPIVAGMFGSNNTAELCEKIKQFDFTGIDAILSSSPSYNKPTQEGIYQHYMKVAEVSPLPIIIYNVPSRTASNIEADTIVRLANDHPHFIAVKEASGDINQGEKIIANKPDHFLVLSGDDPTALELCTSGGEGCISVIANAYPREWSNLIQAVLNKQLQDAHHINDKLHHIHQWLYVEGNPVGIKAALELLGFGNRSVRLPLLKLTEDNYANLKKEMLNIDVDVFTSMDK